MSTYSQSVKKILSQELGQEISTYSAETISLLISKINNYLKKIDLWNKRTTAYYNKIAQNDPNMKEELKRYIASKQMIKIAPEIEDLLKEGYKIIDIIREKITGEQIKYFIGVEYKGHLYEGYLSMEQILDMAKVTPQWKGSLSSMIKLRLSGTNKRTLADLLEDVGSFRNSDNKHSTLYSAVRAYASSNGKTNQGNVYETYRALKSRYKSNDIPPAVWDPDEFDALYLATRKNTGSFVTGGDILNDQIKFFGGSVPSLASISTIRDTLFTFTNLLSTLSGAALDESLNQLFNNNSDIDKASLEVDDFIDDVVDEKILPLILK